MLRKLIVAAICVVALSSCASTVSVENQGDGTCKQTTSDKVFGLTYSSGQNLINCDKVGE